MTRQVSMREKGILIIEIASFLIASFFTGILTVAIFPFWMLISTVLDMAE
ncbi:hypothetical protein [Desulfurobacterium indicum]|nr:hypothetical protein [Desulfurobacterium indicum]